MKGGHGENKRQNSELNRPPAAQNAVFGSTGRLC